MQIVTDSGTDLNLSLIQAEGMEVHIVPLVVSLDN
jgi:fatty acid-binding protein DegV